MTHSASSTHQNGGHIDTAADGAITGDHSPRSDKEIVDQTQTEAAADGGVIHSFGFWMVFVSLCLASFLAALDVTLITTALPAVTREIGGQDKYVWIANCYVITSTALQPLFGQLSNIFGRRWVTITAVGLFLLRNGLAGGATNVGALLLGLIMGGQVFPWSSWHIIVPIVLGGIGIGLFIGYESTSFCKEPTIPLKLFGNRTSSIAYALTFLSAMLLQWSAYYLPMYFQAVQLSNPTRAGVQILPLNTFLILMTIIAGIIVSKTGKYLPVHVISFALMSLSFGLFASLDQHTGTAEWVLLQIVAAAGLGFTMNSPLTALQASLPDSYVFGQLHGNLRISSFRCLCVGHHNPRHRLQRRRLQGRRPHHRRPRLCLPPWKVRYTCKHPSRCCG